MMKMLDEFPGYGIDGSGEIWSFKRKIPVKLKTIKMVLTIEQVKLCKNGVYYCRSVNALRKENEL